jgi:hypothetical protein
MNCPVSRSGPLVGKASALCGAHRGDALHARGRARNAATAFRTVRPPGEACAQKSDARGLQARSRRHARRCDAARLRNFPRVSRNLRRQGKDHIHGTRGRAAAALSRSDVPARVSTQTRDTSRCVIREALDFSLPTSRDHACPTPFHGSSRDDEEAVESPKAPVRWQEILPNQRAPRASRRSSRQARPRGRSGEDRPHPEIRPPSSEAARDFFSLTFTSLFVVMRAPLPFARASEPARSG